MLMDDEEKTACRRARTGAATALLAAAFLLAPGLGIVSSAASARAQTQSASPAKAPLPAHATAERPAPGPATEVATSPLTTGSIATATRPAATGTARSLDRRVVMALLMLCFVGMAAASLSFWRHSIRDVIRAENRRHGR